MIDVNGKEEGKEEVTTNSSTPISSVKGEVKVVFFGQPQLVRPVSVVSCIQSNDLRVIPIIALDFSLGNLTFEEDLSLHNADPKVPNDYRDIVKMIAQNYANVTNLAIFGYGAKTITTQKKSSLMFPLTRNIRNPFTPNHPDVIDSVYSNCLHSLEMSVPITLTPTI